jgi:hypothetical protein
MRGQTWNLTHAAEAAGVRMRTARTPVVHGLAAQNPQNRSYKVILRVAAISLGTPESTRIPASPIQRLTADRNRTAVRFARVIAADAQADPHASVLLTPIGVFASANHEEVITSIALLYPHPLMVILVGR